MQTPVFVKTYSPRRDASLFGRHIRADPEHAAWGLPGTDDGSTSNPSYRSDRRP